MLFHDFAGQLLEDIGREYQVGDRAFYARGYVNFDGQIMAIDNETITISDGQQTAKVQRSKKLGHQVRFLKIAGQTLKEGIRVEGSFNNQKAFFEVTSIYRNIVDFMYVNSKNGKVYRFAAALQFDHPCNTVDRTIEGQKIRIDWRVD